MKPYMTSSIKAKRTWVITTFIFLSITFQTELNIRFLLHNYRYNNIKLKKKSIFLFVPLNLFDFVSDFSSLLSSVQKPI